MHLSEPILAKHYIGVIMATMASQITSFAVVYSIVYSGADQRKHQTPRHWPLCGEFTGIGEFPAQRASNVENISIWWRHHEYLTPHGIHISQGIKGCNHQTICMENKTIQMVWFVKEVLFNISLCVDVHDYLAVRNKIALVSATPILQKYDIKVLVIWKNKPE